MTRQATGTFEVEMQPQGDGDVAEGSSLSRMSLEKRFSGDLEASGKGEMLAARADVATSAVYVAIERVSGSLHGRAGSFVLVHKGVMTEEARHLVIEVAPDTATGQLKGLTGTLDIRIEDGRHHYDFEYSLPGA
jgi:hypothetical protein